MTSIALKPRALRPAPAAAIIGVLLLALAFSCARDGGNDPRDLLRDLPGEIVNHLVSSDDSTLARYGRSVGWVVLTDAVKSLNRVTYGLRLEGRENDASAVTAYQERIAGVLAKEFGYRFYLHNIAFLDSLPPATRRDLLKLERDFYSYRAEVHRSAGEKIERYEKFRGTFERYRAVLFVALSEYELAYAWKTLGDESRWIEKLRAARSRFAECGLTEMVCTTLCEFGEYFEGIGEIDSMVHYYEEARSIAERSRLPAEAADVNSCYAKHYVREGRLSLAHNLLSAAMDACREYKGEYLELGYIVEAMIFEADIGCWQVVDRLLARARVLQTRHGDDLGDYRELYGLRIDLMEGRLRMAKGDVDRAEAFFRKAAREIGDVRMPYTREPELARVHLHWAEGLLENDRPKRALEVARRGLEVSMEASLADYAARLSLIAAKAAFRAEDTALCRRSLEQFDVFADRWEKPIERERIEKLALLGKLEFEGGDRRSAERAFEAAANRLRRFAATTDASVQGYLQVDRCDALRELALDLTAHDPALGYGTVLLWRESYRLLGGGADAGRNEAGGRVRREDAEAPGDGAAAWTLGGIGERAAASRERLARLGAIHCVYAIRGDRIWRWTVSAEGVERDVLDPPAEEVRSRVDRVWEAAANPNPDAGSPHILQEDLRALGRSLLPLRVLGGADFRHEGPLFVTADGFLGRVPFEAFDVGTTGEYVPLLERCDVAYLRYSRDANRAPSSGRGVVLVSPSPSTRGASHRFVQQELTEALKEGGMVAALDRRALFLAGKEATKNNLRSAWRDAPFIYLATHVLRDPQVTYLMLIPLAEPEGPAAPDEAYLEFADVRAADFDRCDIVVLSGCSSGAPYLDVRIEAPSLGDAFVDAGARAVVQTFWDVRDEDAARLMERFIPMWEDPATSEVRALSEARRSAFRASRGVRDLSSWASYYIETSGP